MEELFELFKTIGIKKGSEIENIVFNLNDNKVFELLEKSISITDKFKKENKIDKKNNLFDSFTVNYSLSGGVEPCFNNECRLKSTYKTALFASIYPKKVYINNLLAETYYSSKNIKNTKELKYKMIGDIGSLFILKPLFDRNMVGFKSVEPHFCKGCLSKMMDKIANKLYGAIVGNTKVTLFKDKFLQIYSPDLYDGTIGRSLRKLPDKLLKYKDNLPYTFDKKEIIELRLLDSFVYPIIIDIIDNKYNTQNLNTSFLTNRSLDRVVITSMNRITKAKESSSLTNLEISLPIVEGDINKILKLRESDGLPYEVFRNAFSKILNEIKLGAKNIKMNEVLEEIINPKLQKIQRIFEVNKQKLLSKATNEFITGAFLISPGIFFNNIDLLKYFSAIGGVTQLGSCVKDLLELLDDPVEIKNNDLYFLWKVQKMCSK